MRSRTGAVGDGSKKAPEARAAKLKRKLQRLLTSRTSDSPVMWGPNYTYLCSTLDTAVESSFRFLGSSQSLTASSLPYQLHVAHRLLGLFLLPQHSSFNADYLDLVCRHVYRESDDESQRQGHRRPSVRSLSSSSIATRAGCQGLYSMLTDSLCVHPAGFRMSRMSCLTRRYLKLRSSPRPKSAQRSSSGFSSSALAYRVCSSVCLCSVMMPCNRADFLDRRL